MTRVYIVSSSLFVKGRLFVAARLEEERNDLVRQEAALKERLATYPQRIAEANRLLAEAQLEFKEHTYERARRSSRDVRSNGDSRGAVTGYSGGRQGGVA